MNFRPPLTLKCPVCGVKFRGNAVCSRCSTNLAPLMRIAAKAWLTRDRARRAMLAGDLKGALRIAATARQFQSLE